MNLDDLAHGLDWQGEDLAGWYLSEKFRGVRGLWDGSRLWTRGGNVIAAPIAFTDALPKGVTLDGEVWAGREPIETKARLAARFGGRHWTSAVRLVVFDAPQASGDWLDRMATAKRALAGCPVASVVAVTLCQSTEHAVELMREIQAAGGEGIIARKPGVRSCPGRSRDILKLKRETPATLRTDSEADMLLAGFMAQIMAKPTKTLSDSVEVAA
jgi:DNA ligase-1